MNRKLTAKLGLRHWDKTCQILKH